jgi:hypothetical protein
MTNDDFVIYLRDTKLSMLGMLQRLVAIEERFGGLLQKATRHAGTDRF